jgi:hypothetical protein
MRFVSNRYSDLGFNRQNLLEEVLALVLAPGVLAAMRIYQARSEGECSLKLLSKRMYMFVDVPPDVNSMAM